MKRNDQNFFQPILSVFGLGVTFFTAILPLFSINFVDDVFIEKTLIKLVSFLAFLLGLAIVWLIIELQPSIKIRFRKYYGPELGGLGIVWILIFFDIILAFLFFYIRILEYSFFYGIVQAFIYLIFYLALVIIFSILFAETKKKFNRQSERDNFPLTVFETLEKNRLIKPGIEIYENRDMSYKELQKEGLDISISTKRIKVKTIVQNEEVIEFAVSDDGKEIIKVFKKGT